MSVSLGRNILRSGKRLFKRATKEKFTKYLIRKNLMIYVRASVVRMLQQNYTNFKDSIEESYGFPDVIAEDNAKKMAKISFEIDRAIANGEPIDKLITAYNKLQLQAGFTSDNARDMNSFESVSELALFYEKIGWEKKFHNNELNDVVDVTMRNIQAYNTRLWNNESTIVDQVEERIQQKKNIENIEERLEREDEVAFESPTPLDEDDEVEDFEVEI